jgi:hypothetical protein
MSVMSELSAAFDEIKREVSTTNNGKLMLVNLPIHLRKYVDPLIKMGYLKPAAFMKFGDSIIIS